VIVESKNAKTLRCEERIATRIAFEMLRLKVLSAINFDDEVRRVAKKIGDIGTDWHLSPKARAIHTMGS